MKLSGTGLSTLQVRAESWECDFNGHWNSRFYGRSFRSASHAAQAHGQSVAKTGERSSPPNWFLRFHSEALAADSLEIMSFAGPFENTRTATTHFMLRECEVIAAAIDYTGTSNQHLPELNFQDAAFGLPRSLTDTNPHVWQPNPASDYISELGPILPEELNDAGLLRLENGIGKFATASHFHLSSIGFTPSFSRQEKISRMALELHYIGLGQCKADDTLRCASKIISTEPKTWIVEQLLYTQDGTEVGFLRKCVLAVDMVLRKGTAVPDFVRAEVREQGLRT